MQTLDIFITTVLHKTLRPYMSIYSTVNCLPEKKRYKGFLTLEEQTYISAFF
jgi:hypothetical protein